MQAGAALPPLVVDDDEAVAIAVGLRTAAGAAVNGIEDSSVRALAKVVQVLPRRLRRRVDALGSYAVPATLGGPTVDAGALTVIASACRDEERLRFTYTARDRQPEQRLVEPHRLVSLGRRWYLVAWDLYRHDWRTFRVDRLAEPDTDGTRFRPRELPGGDPVAFVQAGISNMPTQFAVEVLVYTAAERVQEHVRQWGEVEPDGTERCLLRMNADFLGWPAMVLGAVGAEFEVIDPPELTVYLREWGERFVRSTPAR